MGRIVGVGRWLADTICGFPDRIVAPSIPAIVNLIARLDNLAFLELAIFCHVPMLPTETAGGERRPTTTYAARGSNNTNLFTHYSSFLAKCRLTAGVTGAPISPVNSSSKDYFHKPVPAHRQSKAARPLHAFVLRLQLHH
jgi:hypothetical protein